MHQGHSCMYPLSQSKQHLLSRFVIPIFQMPRLRLGQVFHRQEQGFEPRFEGFCLLCVGGGERVMKVSGVGLL